MGASAIASAAVLAWAVFSANPAVDGALRSPNLLPWSWGAPTVADTTPDDLIGRAQGRDPFASHNHVDPPAPTKPVEVVDEQILRVMGTVVDSSGASFGSVVTGVALDSSDTIASTVICLQSAVTNLGAGSTIFGVPLNQRASFRWVASPGSEFVAPATACNGFAIATPTASAVNIEAYTLVNEL